MSPEQIEEMTENFLRDNCQYFCKKNRSRIMSQPYESKWQRRVKKAAEIPFSSLSNKQKRSCQKLGDSLDYEGAVQ